MTAAVGTGWSELDRCLRSVKLPHVERYLIKLQEDEKLFLRVCMTETNLLMDTLQGKWSTVRNLKA